ncbi:unnamed protein product [Medioppia subpectinata]|uniref:TRASH domain-containing protein n=1 Tax=Medioppia subpectinata TaxID=1979941 RepID=A0A7R9KHF6_9ACAR|nr:unnamed protein product [Medioppia subpectinata]CAG2102409.1 unnamed protein product [Medioppia subpectinata]
MDSMDDRVDCDNSSAAPDVSQTDETIGEECNECVDYMMDLVSLSMSSDDMSRDHSIRAKKSNYCLIDEFDDEVTAEVKDLMDYVLDLVSSAVPSNASKAATNGSIVDFIDDDIQIIQVEKEEKNIEVIDLTDSQYESQETICLVCGQNKEIKFKVKINDKIENCCSLECVATLRTLDSCSSCMAIISIGEQGFSSNFGANATLCSQQCLQKSDIQREPNTNCFTCRKVLTKDKVIYYWQTMEFCSSACVQSRQLVFGSKCAQCQTLVNRQSLGKYSVRFGDTIKQFCVGTCLETYKKSLKVCAFCQKDLKCCVTICIASFGFGEKMRLREFCDQICKSQYELMLNSRGSSQVACGQCRRTADTKNIIEFKYKNKKYSLCSSTCVAAFKYGEKLKAIFCENCHNYGWANTLSKAVLHVLHFSGTTRVFCTKKCMSMYVLKNRKIVACLCCKVKKYNFDLIERYDWSQTDSRLFCSLNCLTLFDVAEEEKAKLVSFGNTKLLCKQCNACTTPQFFLREAAFVRNFCSYQCVFNYQRHHMPQSLLPIADNGVDDTDPTLLSSTMWTPSFYGQQKPSSNVSSQQMRPNILLQKRAANSIPLANKNMSSNVSDVTNNMAENNTDMSTEMTDAVTTQTNGTTTGTQILIKEIIKETKEVIVKVPEAKVVRNKCTQFRPHYQTKATSCKPFQADQQTQTDPLPKTICPLLLPIPIFVPVPISYMQPLAVPLPLPIPFFLKPDPPPPPQLALPPLVEELHNNGLNLTDQQFGDIEELLTADETNLKRKSQTQSAEGSTSKRGRRQSTATPKGRGGRGRGRGGRGGGRGRGRGRGKKREEWEISSEEEEEEEASLDDSDEEYEEENESSNTCEEFQQTPQQSVFQTQLDYELGLQTQAFNVETVETTPAARGRGRGRGRGQTSAATSAGNSGSAKRGRRKKEEEEVVDENAFESQLSTNTPNAGINALRIWLRQSTAYYQTKNILQLHQNYLSEIFCKFVEEICQVHGQAYSPDYIYMLCLDLQKHLAQNNRLDNIFMDPSYKQFIHAIHTRLVDYSPHLTCIQEEHLWECGQLGAHSPTVLLNTVMYLATKYFHMIQLEEHTHFSFNNLSKEWANDATQCLVFESGRGRKKRTLTLYENVENQLRCPVKLFDFYLSKCPENVTQRRDMFYLYPIEGCVPDSQTWYSSNPMTNASVTKMLRRILDALKKSRKIDDNIIHLLNTSLPTDSFANKTSDAGHQCKHLYHQIQDSYSQREKSIKQCISVVSTRVKQLKDKRQANDEDLDVMKSLRKEQTRLRLMQNELNVEEVVKDRTLKVFDERCRTFYKPSDLNA